MLRASSFPVTAERQASITAVQCSAVVCVCVVAAAVVHSSSSVCRRHSAARLYVRWSRLRAVNHNGVRQVRRNASPTPRSVSILLTFTSNPECAYLPDLSCGPLRDPPRDQWRAFGSDKRVGQIVTMPIGTQNILLQRP